MKFFLIFLISFCFLSFGVFLWQGVYLPKSTEIVEKLFVIEQGKGAEEIAIKLENQGLIKHRYLFKFYVLTRKVSPELQAGAYLLSPSMSISEIADKITAGDVFTKKITIPEGFNSQQIYRRLKDAMGTSPVRLITLKKYQGYLFPDTYKVSYGMKEEEIIKMMIDNFKRKTVNLEITSEIIIMASLIEEEVRKIEDKKIVSGIFWKRIDIGMPLQSCATIAYILQKEDWTFQEMRREVGKGKQIDSPYNTYMHRGLPIGPISNPGINSILAAIYPETSNYLFFLSTPAGETIFSRTLQEHNIAKAKYF